MTKIFDFQRLKRNIILLKEGNSNIINNGNRNKDKNKDNDNDDEVLVLDDVQMYGRR